MSKIVITKQGYDILQGLKCDKIDSQLQNINLSKISNQKKRSISNYDKSIQIVNENRLQRNQMKLQEYNKPLIFKKQKKFQLLPKIPYVEFIDDNSQIEKSRLQNAMQMKHEKFINKNWQNSEFIQETYRKLENTQNKIQLQRQIQQSKIDEELDNNKRYINDLKSFLKLESSRIIYNK